MTNSVYGIIIMLILGIFAWVLEENGFPVAPIILGLVLGEMFEQNFMTSMIKADGSLLGFFSRPIAATLGLMTIVLWVYMLWRNATRGGQTSAA
jgi:TctA family transporter